MNQQKLFPKQDAFLSDSHPGPWTVKELEAAACGLLMALMFSLLYGLVVTVKLIDARHQISKISAHAVLP